MNNKTFTLEDQTLLENLMLHRRDVRGNNFLHDEVSEQAIEKILNAASLAPSVGFSQPWEFVVIRDSKTKKQVHDSFKVENQKAETEFSDQRQAAYKSLKLEGILEAPVNIAVFYKPTNQPVLGQASMPDVGEYSVVCAIQNMWLMARAMNIGIGWVSILDPKHVKTILKSPDNNKLVAYLCVGYVKEFYSEPELQKLKWAQRKELKSTVFNDSYPSNSNC